MMHDLIIEDAKNTISKCPHSLKDQITSDHEIICKSCGSVLGLENVQETLPVVSINLFQEVQPGCQPVKLAFYYKHHEQKHVSSLFSNVCNKLNLPRYVSLTAWNIFIKLIKNYHTQHEANILRSDEKQNPVFLSRGAIALFSLFIACRQFCISKSEEEIRDAVKFAFSIKYIPTLLRIFTIIKPIAETLSIALDNGHLDYYLNIYFKKYNRYNTVLSNSIKQQARLIAYTLTGNDESKARHSVKIVLAGLGVKLV